MAALFDRTSQIALACIVAVFISGFARAQTPEPPTAPPAAPAKANSDEVLKESVGLLSGFYLYQTYLNIGLLADGKAEKVYDEKAARSVLATVLTPLEKVDKQLEKIAAGLSASDREALTKVRSLISLLRIQGKELTTFWDSNRPEDGAKYEATRQEAWRQLNLLLGLDKK